MFLKKSERDTNRWTTDNRESWSSTGQAVEGERQQLLEPSVVFLLDEDEQDEDEEVVGDGRVHDEPVEEPEVADGLAVDPNHA